MAVQFFKKKWPQKEWCDFTNCLLLDDQRTLVYGRFEEYAEFDDMRFNSMERDGFMYIMNSKGEIESGDNIKASSGGKLVNMSYSQKLGLLGCGMFTKGAAIGDFTIGGRGGYSSFICGFDLNGKCTFAFTAGETIPNEEFDPNAIYVDYTGKLLKGNSYKSPLTDSEVELIDVVGNIIESTVTDEYGDFAFRNLDARTTYSVNAKPEELLPNDEKIYLANSMGVIKAELNGDLASGYSYSILPKELNEIAQMSEMDTELKLDKFLEGTDREIVINDYVYYYSGASRVPSDYKKVLSDVAKKLRSNSDLKLEVSSHTDAIGESDVNMELSEKRANEIVSYLVGKGVSADRLKAIGYGETQIMNRCVDGVTDCSEEELRANRRTELRFYR